MTGIIRSAEDVAAMQLVANRQCLASGGLLDYWAGVCDALAWLCEQNAAPAVDARWELYVKARRKRPGG